MQTLKVKWTGIRPLICHNGYLADRLNPFTREIGEIINQARGARRSTEANDERRDRLEWEGGLYWDTDIGGPIIPPDNIEKCIEDGAKKARLGKAVKACVFCTEPVVPIEYDGPRDMQKLYSNSQFVSRRGIRVGNGRIIRVRPMFPTGWTLTFGVEYDETIINRTGLKKAMEDAGSLIGLGDWRPKFGRFIVETQNN